MVDSGKVAHWVIFALCEELRDKGLFTSDDFARTAARLRGQKTNTRLPETSEEMEAAARFLDGQAQ